MFIKGLVVATVLAVGVASPAAAKCRPINEGGDYRPCVTWDEYQAVNLGMRMNQVQRIFDTGGKRANAESLAPLIQTLEDQYAGGAPITTGDTVRTYPACGDGDRAAGTVYVSYSTRKARKPVKLLYLDGIG